MCFQTISTFPERIGAYMKERGSNNSLLVLSAALIALTTACLYGEEYKLASPSGKIEIKVLVDKDVRYAVYFESKEIIVPSRVSLTIEDLATLGKDPSVSEVRRGSRDDDIHPVVRTKSEIIEDRYNELTLDFAGDYGVDFRAYDDGIAWRFRTGIDRRVKILNEEVAFTFATDHKVYFPEEESYLTHSERLYKYIKLSEITAGRKCSLPALVDIEGGPKVAITESDLEDYPGLYLTGDGGQALRGVFPAVALKEEQTNDRTVKVVSRADYIAETDGQRSFPWRVLVIAKEDAGLIESRLVFKLAKPLQLEDTSWIKPGKVAWDWWNANNIYGVDFKAGINTETYKFYIDFAAKYGIEYIILDEGWYELGDLFKINPEIDMEELLSYAKEKDVGIILWVVWKTLDDQLTEVLDQFEEWGVKGIKVDFMQRDDQWMVNYYHKIAREAARRHLIVDFHGSFKPSGLRRAYPNVLTREGVKGLENSKWSEHPSPEHNVTLPFIRMLAGPMDYTPGAMINAQEKNFRAVFTRPMSMGTRCHQLAMYVVFESPLQMLADSPSNYLREPDCMNFLSRVPTVWDETKVLAGKVADYVLIARRGGGEWYVGAMTDWIERDLNVELSFLDDGEYSMEIYQDGPNADRCAVDYQKIVKKVTKTDSLKIKLAPGGGWAARITKLPVGK